MHMARALLAVVVLIGGVATNATAADTGADGQPIASDWMACPNNQTQEPAAWYVGPYKGPDNDVDGIALARDLYCAKLFKEQHYPRGFITVFGSSRIQEATQSILMSEKFRAMAVSDQNKSADFKHFYKDVSLFAKEWSEQYGKRLNLPILTGAGPGLMEAASRGALAGGGVSIGYTTYYQIPPSIEWTGRFSRYNGEQITTTGLIFSTVSARETAMITHSAVAIFAPGGTGTSWEVFQTLEMMKSRQLHPIPIYFLGKDDEWAPLMAIISDMRNHGTIPKEYPNPMVIHCHQHLVDHVAYDLKLSTVKPPEPEPPCDDAGTRNGVAKTEFEKKLDKELGIR
jgi:predicted Rossmann-fold nucleotide-binding protein